MQSVPEAATPQSLLGLLVRVVEARDADRVAELALDVAVQATGMPGFVARDVGGRLRVVRFQGVEPEELREVLNHPDFRAAASGWRERPVADTSPADVPVGGPTHVACGPLVTDRWEGLVGILAPKVAVADALPVVSAVGRQASVALRQVQVRRELDDRDHEVDAVVHTIPTPALVVDQQGRLVRVNGAACELFGLSGSFDSARPVRGRLGDEALESLLLDAGMPGDTDVELGTPRRRYRAIVGHVHMDGDVRRVLVLQDRSAEWESRQVKEDFVAVMGHELRTPLTLVRGFMETVVAHEERLDAAERRTFLEKALVQADRLQDLIDDLLVLSTGGGLSLDVADEDVGELAAGVVDDMRARYPDRSVEAVLLGGDSEAQVDARRTRQVIRHLLDNALKYSEGPVRVEVRGVDGAVEVAVVDQGPGIFSGDLDSVFEPFRQLDGTSTRRHGGTGTGLHLCRRLLERMGGRLDVDSRLGQGSRFSFRLPRTANHRSGDPQRHDRGAGADVGATARAR